MKKCFIHIGGSKTGSSSIQKSLFEFFKESEFNNVVYPIVKVIDNGVSHNAFTCCIQEYENLQRQYKAKYKKEEISNLSEKYIEQFLHSLKGDLILSSEYFSFFNHNEISRLKNQLLSAGYEKFCVLYYVRDPAKFYASAVQQQLKGNRTFINPSKFDFSIKSKVESWTSIFSPEDSVFKLKSFRKNDLYQECVVKDAILEIEHFLKCSGLRNKVSIKRVNESLSLEAVHVLKKYRDYALYDSDDLITKDAGRLISYLGSFTGSDISLLREVKDLLKYRFSTDLIWLKASYNIDFLGGFDQDSAKETAIEFEKKGSRLNDINDVFEPADPLLVDALSYKLIARLLK